MRKWMQERIKRGKKPSENLSESTGKIGQAIDPMKPAPLMPSYDAPTLPPEDSPSSQPIDSANTAERSASSAPVQRSTQPARRFSRQKRQRSQRRPPGPTSRAPAHHVAGTHETEREEGLGDNTSPNDASAAHQPGAQGEAAAKREPRGVVVLTIGLPGSGKTTWFKRRGVIPLSSDTLRQLLFDDETEQRYQGLIFSTLRSLLRARLIAKRPMNYVDATNLSPHERRQWIKMARGFGYEVHAVFFDVPLELCIERNRKRDRHVDESVMQQMAARLRPPSFTEGFAKIVVVRVKKSDTE